MYQEIYNELKEARSNWKNETEIRHSWLTAIEKELKIVFDKEKFNADASYRNVIIEFKDKGLFHGRKNSLKFIEAIDERLKKYIPRFSKDEGEPLENYVGIAIDGDHIAFAHFHNGKIKAGDLLTFSIESVTMVVKACQLATRPAVTASNMKRDFGHSSPVGSNMMQILCDILTEHVNGSLNSKIKMLYEEWRALYGQVADLSDAQHKALNGSLGFQCAVNNEHRIPICLFTIHTYNSFLIKIIAAEIISEIVKLTSYDRFSQNTANLDADSFIKRFRVDIEKGEIYSRAGVIGFVEEVLFSWYLEAFKNSKYKDDLIIAIKEVLFLLSNYQFGKLDNARTNDVLKQFYQDIVPELLRKSLGEFYTPDWLVEITLDKVKSSWISTRFLDPTCGSASFLLAIISRIKKAAKRKGWDEKKQLEHIVSHVWGFDLNPLAVQTARVNYLIAISDLIEKNPGMPIEIPILLADAIYSPAPDPDGDMDIVTYKIGSSVANLEIVLPTELAIDRKWLDKVFKIMGDSVENELDYSEVSDLLKLRNTLSTDENIKWQSILEKTYNQVLSLHKKNWNGIWFRIVRNYFWSATAGEFDVIVGNPPWVRWSKLPELYRERVKPTCLQYDIFSSTPHHGGNELDISGMITYTVADKWLRMDGQLLFVITQTHFQSPSSQGFRSFKINESTYLAPQIVDDLKELRPFPDAANKTAILNAKKEHRKPKYPIPYTLWHSKGGKSKNIPESINKEDVLARVVFDQQEATPITGEGAPWAILPKGDFPLYKKILGNSTWVQGKKGITCDLNGIYFVRIINQNINTGLVQIETRPEAGKIDIGVSQKFWIEPQCIYPLLKGAGDISPCGYSNKDQLFAIVPNRGITKEEYEKAQYIVENQSANLYNYFETYSELLEQRSTYKGRMKNAPFYAVYNVGGYTFAPWKVVWAEQPGTKQFPVAVVEEDSVPLIGNRPIVPDHKIFFVDFYEPDPAFYLCGMLTSSIVQTLIQSHHIMIQVGNIFKHMNIPPFDIKNDMHVKLVQLTRQAHKTNNKKDKLTILSQIEKTANVIIKMLR